MPSPASEAEQVVDLLAADSSAIVQTGSPPFLKCGLAARDACAVTSRNPSARTRMVVSRRIRLLLPRGNGASWSVLDFVDEQGLDLQGLGRKATPRPTVLPASLPDTGAIRLAHGSSPNARTRQPARLTWHAQGDRSALASRPVPSAPPGRPAGGRVGRPASAMCAATAAGGKGVSASPPP